MKNLLIFTLCLFFAFRLDAGMLDGIPKIEYAPASFQDSISNQVMYLLDAFRMYPRQMAENFRNSEYFEPDHPNDKSLISNLIQMKPADRPLIADEEIYNMAYCHAVSTSRSMETGHKRRGGCPDDFAAECIAYGYSDAERIVLALLRDHGVPDLGHRKILLDTDLRKVGIARAKHGAYRHQTVIDFGR